MGEVLKRCFVRHEGGMLGPFTPEELRQLAADGALPPGTVLEEEGTGLRYSLADLLPPGEESGPATDAAPPATPDAPKGAAPAPENRPALVVEYRQEAGEPARVSPLRGFVMRWGLSVPILVAAIIYLVNLKNWPELTWNLLSYVDLFLHEAGHGLFELGGEFAGFLGGTIMQLIAPAGLVLYFALARQVFSAQFSLFWLGESLLGISIYAADARAQALELIAGDTHDWHYLLGRMGLLEKDVQVAGLFAALAAAAFAAGVLWPLMVEARWPKESRDEHLPITS
ncbi:MAG: hypothetical protein ACM3X6_03120 [Patescibacteria group bacterium]